MWIIAIAWIYVALMMAVADAMHPSGGVVSAVFTFLMYGVGPVALVMYILNTPNRKRARARAEAASSADPDAGGHAAGDAVAAEGIEARVADGAPQPAADTGQPRG
jgi:hypothetical protein